MKAPRPVGKGRSYAPHVTDGLKHFNNNVHDVSLLALTLFHTQQVNCQEDKCTAASTGQCCGSSRWTF